MLSFCTILSAENIIVDAGRNKNLHLDKAANGVPLVNIETPNEKGISHNVFREYHVDSKGVILNNTLEVENSKLGGLIYGNPNLQGNRQNASTILTEVSGVNRSKIEGFTEIVGKQADYILANPNGIYINGAGFINTGNVQFTTGDSQHLQNPEKGQIEIAGKGLDVRNVNKAELIARTAMLTAPIYGGEEVRLQLGSQTTREKPELALDARNLGSIYAGKINIVSNEEGVGVKSSGLLYTNQGNLVIDSKGNAYLQEVHAKKDILIHAKETEVKNALLAEKNIQIKNNFLKNQGKMGSNGRISIEGNIKNEGSIVSHDTFHAKSSHISNEGDISAKTIEIDSDTLTNTKQIKAKDLISIQSKQIHNLAEVLSYGKIHMQAALIKNQKLLAKEGIEITTNSLQSDNMIYSEKDVNMKSDIIQNTGKIVVKGNIQGKARKIENTGRIESTGTTQLQAETIENHELFSNDIKLDAAKIENTAKMVAENSFELQAKIANNHGNIYAGKASKFQVVDFQNKGEIKSIGNIQVQAEKFQNKKLLAKGSIDIAKKFGIGRDSLYRKRFKHNKRQHSKFRKARSKEKYELNRKKAGKQRRYFWRKSCDRSGTDRK